MIITIPVWILWALGIFGGGIVLMLAVIGAIVVWALWKEE